MIFLSRWRRWRCRLTKIVDKFAAQSIENHAFDVRGHRRDLHNHMYAVAPLDARANDFKTAGIASTTVDVVEHEIPGVRISIPKRASEIDAHQTQRCIPYFVFGVWKVVRRTRKRAVRVQHERKRQHADRRTQVHAGDRRARAKPAPSFVRIRFVTPREAGSFCRSARARDPKSVRSWRREERFRRDRCQAAESRRARRCRPRRRPQRGPRQSRA